MGRIDRRDALRRLAAGSIGAAAGTAWVDELSALAREQAAHVHAAIATGAQGATPWTAKALNPHQLATVATLSELIIPQTETPGAKATLVDRFIDGVLAEAAAADRSTFLKGLAWTDARSKALFGKDVVSATPAQQTDLLTRLSAAKSAEAPAGVAFFTAIKSMTITGYYTSEAGLRQELGDDGVLAQATFEGCTHQEHQS
jgi:Gluconate 2-dehydrogenase subunit 3